MNNNNEEWITMTEVSKRLSVHIQLLSRLARKGVIVTRSNPLDARERLVPFWKLKALLQEYRHRDDREQGKTA